MGTRPTSGYLAILRPAFQAAFSVSDESQQLEVLEAAENPHSEMAKTLAVREAARVAQNSFGFR